MSESFETFGRNEIMRKVRFAIIGHKIRVLIIFFFFKVKTSFPNFIIIIFFKRVSISTFVVFFFKNLGLVVN